MPDKDPFDLQRFVSAQDRDVYDGALRELRRGRKTGHWMWFIFPQLPLGRTGTSKQYALSGHDEAVAYLAHPVLGPRLTACANALLSVPGVSSAERMLGATDAMKLRSSATLFASVSRAGSVFHQLLDRFFAGEPDPLTVDLLR